MLYGLPNRVMTNLSMQLFKHEHLSKFLHYTAIEYKTKNILLEEKVSASELVDKNIFVGKRVPIIIGMSGAYISFRVYDYYPGYGGKDTYNVEVDIDIIVHKDCQDTIHGTRDITLVTMVHEALRDERLTGIGKCRLGNAYDIRDLDVGYSGYTVRASIKGFPNGIE